MTTQNILKDDSSNRNYSEMNDKSCPRTITFSYFFDGCIQELIARNRITHINIDGSNCNNGSSFSLLTVHKLSQPDVFISEFNIELSEDMIADYPDFYKKHFAKFIAFYDRYTYSFFAPNLRYDQLVVYFNLLYRYFYHHFKTNNVELLIMHHIPHVGGYDLVLYEVARLLGIKTIFFHPLCIENKMFILPDIKALSDHKSLVPIDSKQHIELQVKSPFYMEEVLKKQRKDKIMSWLPGSVRFLSKFISIFCHRFKMTYQITRNNLKRAEKEQGTKWQFLLNRFIIYKGIRLLMSNIKSSFVSAKHENFFWKYSKNTTNINWNDPFVYFPLHVQPELTTTPLGEEYENQLYAIECLARILPDNWRIFIKEHPAFYTISQIPNYWRKHKFFFERIKKIPKLVLISDEIDTYFLIQKSKFVSTITGTVGWETLLNGKQVLVFGNAWYSNFPGCTKYTSTTTLEDIITNEVDTIKLQNSVDFLADRLVTEIVIENFCSSRKNFDIKRNAQSIADAIEKYVDFYFPTKK